MDFSDRLVNAGYAGCVAISLGTLAPWVTAGPATSSGVEVDGTFGIYTFLLGMFAAFILWRWSEFPKSELLIGLAIVGGLCFAETAYFLYDLQPLIDAPGITLDAGFGLYLSLAGSALVLVVTALLYRRDPA